MKKKHTFAKPKHSKQPMKTVLFIFLGGGTGSIARYTIQLWVNKSFPCTHFPLATFIINIFGSFLIGLFFALSARFNLSHETRLLLIAGLCGGFTTFSAFSNENLHLLKDGLYGSFFYYVVFSIALGIAGTFAGNWTGNHLL